MLRCFLLAILISGACWAGPYSLTLPPGSSIQGNPGDAVGWGYSIINNSADFLETTGLNVGLFPSGITPNNIFDFPIVAPDSTVTLDFSTVVTGACGFPDCGIYEVMLDSSVKPGTSVSGTFDVTVELFSGDPFNGGMDLGPGADLTADFTATAAGGSVPEPSTFLEFSTALLLVIGGSLITRRLRLSLRPVDIAPAQPGTRQPCDSSR
jgi:hypothetical protein